MTIGSSPFLTADVDETFGFGTEASPSTNRPRAGAPVSARIELIRRRVLTGYYSSPVIATELARRLLDGGCIDDC
jgi:hypothetical protein